MTEIDLMSLIREEIGTNRQPHPNKTDSLDHPPSNGNNKWPLTHTHMQTHTPPTHTHTCRRVLRLQWPAFYLGGGVAAGRTFEWRKDFCERTRLHTEFNPCRTCVCVCVHECVVEWVSQCECVWVGSMCASASP